MGENRGPRDPLNRPGEAGLPGVRVRGCDPAPEWWWRHLHVCPLASALACAPPRGPCRGCQKGFTAPQLWRMLLALVDPAGGRVEWGERGVGRGRRDEPLEGAQLPDGVCGLGGPAGSAGGGGQRRGRVGIVRGRPWPSLLGDQAQSARRSLPPEHQTALPYFVAGKREIPR